MYFCFLIIFSRSFWPLVSKTACFVTVSTNILDLLSYAWLNLLHISCVSQGDLSYYFYRKCQNELPWYFVWQLTQNYPIVWGIWCKIILLISQASHVELAVYFVACHMVNILDFLFDSSTWIFLIFCWISHCDLSHYSVRHLTVNYLDSISKESCLINPIFYHMSDMILITCLKAHGECHWYSVCCLANFMDILSYVCGWIILKFCRVACLEYSEYFVYLLYCVQHLNSEWTLFLFGVSQWIIFLMYGPSHSDLFRCLVRCLTVNYVDMVDCVILKI